MDTLIDTLPDWFFYIQAIIRSIETERNIIRDDLQAEGTDTPPSHPLIDYKLAR